MHRHTHLYLCYVTKECPRTVGTKPAEAAFEDCDKRAGQGCDRPAGVAQVPGLIPAQGTCLGCRRQSVDVSLSRIFLCLSLSLPLSQ